MKKFLALVLVVVLSILILPEESFGQSRKHAFNLLDHGNIEDAQKEYLELMKTQGNDPLICFETGIAFYMGNSDDKAKSVEFFELAKKNSVPGDTIPELFYYLGRAYQASNDFGKAKKMYDSFESNLETKSKKRKKEPKAVSELRAEVDDYVEQVLDGLRMIRMTEKNPLTNVMVTGEESKRYYIAQNEFYTVENLGPQVNSPYHDYAPVFADGEQTILFKSRRNKKDHKKFPDGMFYEDIFISKWNGEEWGEAVNIDSSSIFLKDARKSDFHHNATVSINADETELYTYALNNIFVSVKEEGRWGKPKKMSSEINVKKARQSSAVISPDGRELWVVSNIEGGFGGSDIYISKREDGDAWGPLVNAGEVINTEKDEETPWLNPSMDTLFFSSKGHRNIGGFDVFYSVIQKDGTWSRPKNMGIPVNTALDELSYMESTTNSRFAYYASNRTGGHGDFDIYHISRKFEEGEDMLAAEQRLAKRDSVVTVKRDSLLEEIGKKFDEVYQKKIQKSLADGDITHKEVTEEKFDEEPVAQAQEPKKEEPAVEETPTSEAEPSPEPEPEATPEPEPTPEPEVAEVQELEPSPSALKIDQSCEELMNDKSDFADIHFGFNSTDLPAGKKAQLDRVAEQLKQDKYAVMNLTGHTDDRGSEEVNQVVTQLRVEAVYRYMTELGVEPTRFVIQQFGENQPKVSNDSPRCRAANRRVELSLLKNTFYGNIYFDLNSFQLSAKSNVELDRLVSFLKQNSSSSAQLFGYTDPSGSADYNRMLANKRIMAAIQYLNSKGIDASRLKKKILGEDNSLIPAFVSGSDGLNRRVELRVQ